VDHVWTAPWQELSDGLQHWSGAVTCPACSLRQVWPLALMLCADGSQSKARTKSAMIQRVLPVPGTTVSALRRHALAAAAYAASKSAGSLYLSPRTMMAQAIRAILLAKATAATLVGRRAIDCPSQGCFFVPCLCA
jgi:hypothetical protein